MPLNKVQPGDVITSVDWNAMVDAIEALQAGSVEPTPSLPTGQILITGPLRDSPGLDGDFVAGTVVELRYSVQVFATQDETYNVVPTAASSTGAWPAEIGDGPTIDFAQGSPPPQTVAVMVTIPDVADGVVATLTLQVISQRNPQQLERISEGYPITVGSTEVPSNISAILDTVGFIPVTGPIAAVTSGAQTPFGYTGSFPIAGTYVIPSDQGTFVGGTGWTFQGPPGPFVATSGSHQFTVVVTGGTGATTLSFRIEDQDDPTNFGIISQQIVNG